MTLSPVWDETFFILPETCDEDEDPGADGGGVRFEIWDHDMHGGGDYLGAILWSVSWEYGNLEACHPREHTIQTTHLCSTCVCRGGKRMCLPSLAFDSSIFSPRRLCHVLFLVYHRDNKTFTLSQTTKPSAHPVSLGHPRAMQAISERIPPIIYDQSVYVACRTFPPHTQGELCLTNDELKASPPHRAEHKVVEHPARSSDGAIDRDNTLAATNPRQRKAGTKRGAGSNRGVVGASGSPTILALAVQVSWPEDPESAEGKLVRDLQNEQGLLSTRVEALKVGQSTIIATIRYGLARVRDVISRARESAVRGEESVYTNAKKNVVNGCIDLERTYTSCTALRAER